MKEHVKHATSQMDLVCTYGKIVHPKGIELLSNLLMVVTGFVSPHKVVPKKKGKERKIWHIAYFDVVLCNALGATFFELCTLGCMGVASYQSRGVKFCKSCVRRP